ncbi:AMP-binding protein [bacterium]|nr:AMP-binding protein [bacterium]
MSKKKVKNNIGNNNQESNKNIAIHLPEMAKRIPEQAAIMFPLKKEYASWTYKKLDETADSYAHVMEKAGVKPGDKALVFLRTGPDLIACVFALFKMGVLPVMLDPGMGKEKMLGCIEHVKPDVFIGVREAHLARWFYRSSFKSVRLNFTSTQWFPGCTVLAKEAVKYTEPFPVAPKEDDDTAAILFTSGSTGKAKGVVYKHGMFQAQVKYLKELFNFKVGELDMPGYPLFGLYDVALGMTSVIPRLDPSKPAQCDPALLVEAIEEFEVTTCQGSPIIWRRVADYCNDEDIELESLQRVITFGAPIPFALLDDMFAILPEEAEIYTPYGATESLPVALIPGSEVVDKMKDRTIEGAGTCVGKPIKGMDVRIIKITDEPIEKFSEDLVLPDGEVGEIAVHGPVVTQEYYHEDEANQLAKMDDGQGGKWHRMGDTGYFDSDHNLWFCGRKAHRVVTAEGTLFPVQVEGMANNHPRVFRSALVGIGPKDHKRPIIIVEPKDGCFPEDEKQEELFSKQILGRYDEGTPYAQIKHVFFKESFPVDPRHNVKIDREELAQWAEEEWSFKYKK